MFTYLISALAIVSVFLLCYGLVVGYSFGGRRAGTARRRPENE